MKNFYKATLATMLMMLLSATVVLAQTNISGKVTDAITGEGLAGVNIIVRGRVIGTVSDANGSYSLKANDAPPLTLVFSFVGYKTFEVEVSDANYRTRCKTGRTNYTWTGSSYLRFACRRRYTSITGIH
jgi:hypothetical protein